MNDWHTYAQASPRLNTSWKQYLEEACPHGRAIVLVDGTYVRNHYDSDFSQGGNGYRYRFIPRGEIWIDAHIPEEEWPLIAFHECQESELMKLGWTYSRAHDRSKQLEDSYRHASLNGNAPMTKKSTPPKKIPPWRKPPPAKKTPSRRKSPPRKTSPVQRPKLTPRERELASKYIPVEHQSFPHRQAIAVGISHARQQTAREKVSAIMSKHLKTSK